MKDNAGASTKIPLSVAIGGLAVAEMSQNESD
jgi:hypothetical protein